MRKILLLIIICVVGSRCIAQVNNDLIIEQIERMSENSEDESIDYSELLEAYWSLLDDPININSDEAEQLVEFKLISVFQLEKIKSYRKEYGDFQFVEELCEVEGLDNTSIEIIKGIICFEDNKNKNISFKDLKYGRHKILMEVNQCLNTKKGYLDIEDSLLFQKPNSIYLGSPQRLYLRYNYTYKDKIEYGFVMEKDPGEYLSKRKINDSIRTLLDDKCYNGFDFYTFHIIIHNFGFLIRTLAIGDYKISFGQGLSMGSGMAFAAKGGCLLRRGRKITASKSANEAYYLRGVASTLKYNNLELSLFYSNKKTDANVVTYDSLNEMPLQISGMQHSGLHRTYNEMMDRKAIRQQLYGLNLSYRKSNFQIGYTIHRTNLSTELNPDNNIYKQFYFRGRNLLNQSVDFYHVLDKLLLYGEMAMSDNKGMAGLVGMTVQPAGYIEFTLLYRNYAKDYQCLYSNAYAVGNKNSNEKGWYFSSVISISANWKLISTIDFYESDWFKNTAYFPTHAYDFDSQLNYQPNNNALFFIEFRNKDIMKNTSHDDVFQKYPAKEKNNMIRFHASYQISDDISLRNRVEYHFDRNEGGANNSYLIYQDIIYNSLDNQYSLALRYGMFNAEKGSVYAYENDVLYSFAVGGLSGKGIRTYLVGRIKLSNKIQVSGKMGVTFYDNKNEIGSGLETIYNNRKGDAKLQFIWSL